MLNEAELRALLREPESDRVEMTESTGDTDKFCEAICAFANDLPGNGRPGYLLVGVMKNGRPLGVKITDQILQNLASLRSDGNIQPMPAMTVQRHALGDGEVAVVEVAPADLPPVRYRGRVFVRLGPRRDIASEQEERALTERRTASARTFDARPCTGCTLDDLALDLFLTSYRGSALAPEVIEENNREVQVQLASLRFFNLKRDCPTNAGALLFAKDPLAWLPGACVQYVQYAGPALADTPVSEKRFSGDLLTVLRSLNGFLPTVTERRPVAQTPLRETMVHDYPTLAIRELLMNAIMHRNYESTAPVRFYRFSDRIEIQSPGGLYGEATAENFPRQNSYRNPVVAEAMHALGFANRYGRGVERARDALARNGNPEAVFEFTRDFVLVTMRPRP